MKGKDNLVQQFITNESPYFLIVDFKNNCIGKNDKHGDIDTAATRLMGFLSSLDPEIRSKYMIYCYEELPEGKLKGKVKDILSLGEHDYLMTYCPYEPKPIEEADERVNRRVQYEMEKREMKEKLDRIEAALMAKNIADNAEDEDDIAEEVEPKGIMGALMDNPQIQGALAGAVSAWIAKMMQPQHGPMAVAGVPGVATVEDTEALEDVEDIRIDAALSTLSQYDDKLADHLEKLAEMAVKDTGKFKFLLTML
jgi:hypothetical protein